MEPKPQHHPLIIIGSGPAGLTAGLYASRSNLNPLIIKGTNPGGQLMGTTYVDNWPGQNHILGADLIMRMQEHAEHFGTQFLDETVVTVNFKQKPFTLVTDKNTLLSADAVIIATGALPKNLNCAGEKEYWGKGVSTCAVCDGAFYKDKQVIIVGGGDSAMEAASFMLNYTKKITLVHILDQLSASPALQQRIIRNAEVSLIFNSTVTAIQGDTQKVTDVIITHQKTNKTTTLETDAVFIAIGLHPNVMLFKEQIALNKLGFIQIENNTCTNIPGVFAAGDVADSRYRQAITAAGSGCMAALDAERYLNAL